MRSKSRVRVGRDARNRSVRFDLEALEGRLVLSSLPTGWVSIGPAPITDPFSQNLNYNNNNYVNPPEITGAIQAVATYKTPEGNTGAYIGAPLGGVWQTQDLLAASPTWSTHTDNLPSLAINTLGISPLDTTGATVFAGTGPTSNGGLYWHGYGNYPDLSTLETGLYLSTNAGQTWTALNDASSPVYGTFISKVLPTAAGGSVASETVLVGTERGLFVSNDGGSTFAPQTFTNPVLDVIADPLRSDRFYLLAGPDPQGNGAGIYLSDDTGSSWTSINGGAIDASVLALFPTNGAFNGAGRLAATTNSGQTLLYMSFENNTNQNTYGVFRTPITTGGTADWQAYYTFPTDKAGGSGNNLGLIVDPGDPNVVYTAGYGDNATYRIEPDSTTGQGKPIQLTNEDDGSLYDTRALAFATDGNGHEVLILTSDSGIYSLKDPTTATALPTWKPLTGNISVTEAYSVTAMAGPFGQLYVGGGAQDTAAFQTSISPAGQTNWVAVNGGDGYGSAYDPSVGMLYATSDTLADIQVAQSGTNTIEPVTFTGFNSLDNGAGAFPSLAAVSATGAGGPYTPRPVVLSAFGLYEAQPASLTSGQVSVIQINAPVNTNDTYSALSFGGTYQGAPDPYILYAARGDGTLWFSDTFGTQAVKLTGWTGGTIIGLQQDPANSHHVYALTKTSLYVTEDAGQTWTSYAVQPPSSTLGSFLSLGLVPATVAGTPTNLLLVGGLHGAEVLPDAPSLGLTAWSPAGTNLPNAIVTGFSYVPSLDTLALSTFGRGDWIMNNASTQLLGAVASQSVVTVSAPSTSAWGTPALLSAQVAAVVSGSGVPTGVVSFSAQLASSSTVPLGSGSLDASGDAQLFLPGGLPSGTLAIVANYAGDGTFGAAQGQAAAAVDPAATTLGLTAPGTALPTRPLTLTAQVLASSGGTAPTGVITFLDGGKTLGTAALNGAGVASLTLPALSVGTHSLTARYTPNLGSSFAASETANPSTLTVRPVATTVGLVAPGRAFSASPLQMTAIVGAADGSGGILGGSVTFYDGSTPIGTIAVSTTHTASLTVPSLSPGTHALRAVFHPAPGSPFLASLTPTATIVQVVPNPSEPIATTTTLTGVPMGPARLGRRTLVRFDAQVNAPLGAAPTPLGLVEFLAGGKVVAINALDSHGQAHLTIPAGQVFNRPVLALYLGGSRGASPARPSQSAALTPTPRGLQPQVVHAARIRHGRR